MAAPQSASGQPDHSTGILWIIAAVFFIGAMIWIAFSKYIILGFFHIKLWDIYLVSTVTHFLGVTRFDDDLEILRSTLNSYIKMPDPKALTFHQVMQIGSQVGDYIKIPFCALLFVLAIIVYLGNSTRVFKRIYSMKELVQLEKNNWPQIMPVAHLELLKEDLDKGPWAMAMTPLHFCKKYHLLEEYKRASEGLTLKERNRIEVALKRGLATKVFSLQMGPVWQGIDKLTPHARALFAAFAARINADSKPAEQLFLRMAATSTTKLDFTGTEELLQKHASSKAVQTIINSHAYVLTVMASMLLTAREDGVQPTADFLWLKPLDRRLWYMLNTVGRQTPFVEVAGPFGHWKAELLLGKKILVPLVDEATNALEIALKEMIYKPDEPAE